MYVYYYISYAIYVYVYFILFHEYMFVIWYYTLHMYVIYNIVFSCTYNIHFNICIHMYTKGKQTPKEITQNLLNKHWKIIFNGNGYDPTNQQDLTNRGLFRIDSAIDAIERFTIDKNINLFTELNILSKEECHARQNVLLSQYIGIVEMEVLTLIDMLNQYIIPAMKKTYVSSDNITSDKSGAGSVLLTGLQEAVVTLNKAVSDIHHASTLSEKVCGVYIVCL